MSIQRTVSGDDKDKCPFCQAPVKARTDEKIIRQMGQKGKGRMVTAGQRQEFVCGAVKLTNNTYPQGTIEAKCCTPAN